MTSSQKIFRYIFYAPVLATGEQSDLVDLLN